jgi:hypothetical protein
MHKILSLILSTGKKKKPDNTEPYLKKKIFEDLFVEELLLKMV